MWKYVLPLRFDDVSVRMIIVISNDVKKIVWRNAIYFIIIFYIVVVEKIRLI